MKRPDLNHDEQLEKNYAEAMDAGVRIGKFILQAEVVILKSARRAKYSVHRSLRYLGHEPKQNDHCDAFWP